MRACVLAVLAMGCAAAPKVGAPAAQKPAEPPAHEVLRAEARALLPLAQSDLGRAFLGAAEQLPPVTARVVFHDKARGRALDAAGFEALEPSERADYKRLELDDAYYFFTRYGSPVSYLPAIDLLAAQGLRSFEGLKLVDYGYGYLGHLKMLASLGADATGVDADPILPVLYGAPGDTGDVGKGRVRVLSGRFPEERPVTAAVGSGYRLFLSKNTLKKGYVHPSQSVEPRLTLQLKVSDAEYVRAVWDLLEPGGWVLLYNLYPAQKPPGQGFIPWAEGQTAFPRAVWEAQGFKVLAFDEDDTARARQLAHALKWDEGEDAMNLSTDLFAVYTLARKP